VAAPRLSSGRRRCHYAGPAEPAVTGSGHADESMRHEAAPSVGGPDAGRGGARPHVCFVRGPIVGTERAVNNEATPCLAFAYLAGTIKRHGYPFTIVDAIGEALNRVWPLADRPGYRCQGLTFDEILERIPAHAGILAFSAMFSGEWPVLRELIMRARGRFPDALFVAGGEHITALTEYSLRDCPAIDLCVRGEGEQKLLDILEAWCGDRDYSGIPGVGFLDAGGRYVEVGGLPRIREVDSIPWPHWPEGYLERFWEAGKSYGVQTERDMPIMASRGCPYQCTFCSNPQMWTTRYVLRDIDDLIAEIKSYIERYDITALQYYDLTAITKKRWTVEFCHRLIAEGIGIKWSLPSGTRSEALDAETLGLLKTTNCNYLVYAPESGSPDTLKRIKKRIDLDKLTESVLEAKRQGIVIRTNLIIGFPHETRRHVFETIRYGLYLAWKGADEVTINIFSPYPGTEIFAELMEAGKIALGDSYFMALTSLNSDYTSSNPLTCNPHMGPRELAFYRISFMLLNYAVGYLRYPSRIVRTLRNVFLDSSQASTVFEHRIKDMFKRRRGSASPTASR
jgi:anaerobic magnesium-protoporphyrin IX monomethyl ester cyclase